MNKEKQRKMHANLTYLKGIRGRLFSTVLIIVFVTVWFSSIEEVPSPIPNEIKSIEVLRSLHNPLIAIDESLPHVGDNINGPSVIRVPAWIEDPLGKYYMYFAHHRGEYIRLAYADNLEGPWSVYTSGVLHLNQVSTGKKHVASPDVHVDNEEQKILMYFHAPLKNIEGQKTLLATSKDGITFSPGNEVLGMSYFRVFKNGEYFYAIDGNGFLNRSKNPESGWSPREKKIIPPVTVNDTFGERKNVRIRHSAVLLENNTLLLFYTRKEDAPERVIVSTVRLADDWETWVASSPLEVMKPEEVYEGVNYSILPSKKGPAINVHQIRDPYVFTEGGKQYLFYSIAGETGIALAELVISMQE